MAAFHGDEQMAEVVRYLATLATGAVETGTFHGDSTAFLAQYCREVATCEIRADFYETAMRRLTGLTNVRAHCGRSQDWVEPTTRDLLTRHEKVLVFLDAHWQDEWPLYAELAALMRLREQHPGRLIVLIDDMEVPGHPNFYGSPGGGGTVGDPIYGPKTAVNHTEANLVTFGRYLQSFAGRWVPCYEGQTAGYLIAADVELSSPLLERL